jgi:hypothetical protein
MHLRPACLDAAVIAADGGGDVVRGSFGIVERQAHVFEQLRSVGLEGEHVIALAPENGLCGVILAVHGIRGDDAALQAQHGQELRKGLDLVGLAVDLALAEDQARLAGEGADQMHGCPALAAVEGAAGRLAVEGDHPLDALGERCGIAGEAGLEGRGIEQAEDAREGVVARDAARQAQEAPQQRLPGTPEERHVDAGLGAAQGGEQRDHHDPVELVPLRVAGARIPEFRETGPKPLHAALHSDPDGGT